MKHLLPYSKAHVIARALTLKSKGGEFQNGMLNFRNTPIQLVQFNTEAVVPFFVSSKGYGLLWDNNAW